MLYVKNHLKTAVFLLALPFAHAVEPACDAARDLMQLHFELNPSGQEKLLKAACERIVSDPSLTEDSIPQHFDFGAKPECKDVATVEKMLKEKGSDYVWNNCPGPPYALVSKAPDDHRAQRWASMPDPSTFHLENVRLRGLKASPCQVHCQARTCRVNLDVDNADLGFDVRMQSLFFGKYRKNATRPDSLADCSSAALRDVKIHLGRNKDNDHHSSLSFAVKFGDPDAPVKAVPLHDPSFRPDDPRDSGRVHLEADSISVQEAVVTKVPAERKAGDPVICPWADSDLMADLTKVLLKAKMHDQFVLDSVSDLLSDVVSSKALSELGKTVNRVDGIARAVQATVEMPEIGISNPEKAPVDLSVLFMAKQTASTLDAVPGFLQVCIDCYRSQVPGLEPAYARLPVGQSRDADVGVHINYLSMNRFLDFMARTGRLNACASEGRIIDCQAPVGPNQPRDQFVFPVPPTTGWDPVRKELYVDVPSVSFATNDGPLKKLGPHVNASFRVYGKIYTETKPVLTSKQPHSGPQIRFEPSFVDLRSNQLSGGVVNGFASRVASFMLNRTGFGNRFGAKATREAIDSEFPIPDLGLEQVALAADPEGLTAFAKIADPVKLIPPLAKPTSARLP